MESLYWFKTQKLKQIVISIILIFKWKIVLEMVLRFLVACFQGGQFHTY